MNKEKIESLYRTAIDNGTYSALSFAKHIAELSWQEAIEEAASECELQMRYPGGKCDVPYYNNVRDAADGIRSLLK